MTDLSYSKYVLLLFMLSELVILSVHMFSQGFLLTREVVKHRSRCSDFHYVANIKSNHKNGCWLPNSFKKTVVIIIDGLRYDFTEYRSLNITHNIKFFQNNMNIFSHLMNSQPGNGILLPFIADPPTTTMQRLKALTTGSLPTFIDVSHNFASAEITEDNLIDQLKDSGKRLIILGDDTWGELFPGRFHRSYLYPSFNVMDLDSVDNGILDNLYSEIRNEDGDIIIAHFLGVDHCGHRYSPNHSEMRRKLLQMNEMIRNVSSSMKNDSLLIVLGDHGMTNSGDHGGDSDAEVKSALFMYNSLLNLKGVGLSRPFLGIPQVDIVPTLSLLLGVPIPYSNLGKIIQPLFDDGSTLMPHSLTAALQLNTMQVNRYLMAYNNEKNEFPKHQWDKLHEIFSNLNKSTFHEKNNVMTEYLVLAKLMCEEIWARFDVSNMFLGIFHLSGIIMIISGFLSPNIRNNSYWTRERFCHITYLFLILNVTYGISYFLLNNVLNILCVLCVFTFFFLFKASFCLYEEHSLESVIIIATLCCGSFSNSFTVSEDSVSSFLFLSMLGYCVSRYFIKKFNSTVNMRPSKLNLHIAWIDIVIIILVFGMFLCIRFSHLFWKCREEQHWCDGGSSVHVPLSALPKESHGSRYSTSLIPLILLLGFPYYWLRSCGNLNDWKLCVFVTRMAPVFCALLCVGYWALQSTSLAKDIANLVVLFPRLIYLIVAISILILFCDPIFVYILPPRTSRINSYSYTEGSIIPQLFMKLKQKYNEQSVKTEKSPPIVYGLATAISAPFIVILQLLLLVVIVISGDGMSPGIGNIALTGVLCLGYHSLISWRNAYNAEMLLLPNWNSVTLWFLLCVHGFYSTGHQATFSTLNWTSAFIGYDGNGSYIIPAVLVLLNTFSSQLLFAVSLPLLLIVPFSFGFLWPSLRLNKPDFEDVSRGEFLLVEKLNRSKESLFIQSTVYLMFYAIKVLVTSVAAFLLRRHLMVWKIFAPHFLFEAVALIITCLGLLIGLTIAFRIMFVLEKWRLKLYHQQ